MNAEPPGSVEVLAPAASAETIDRMVTGTVGRIPQTYTAGGTFLVFPYADHYVLNDGSTWNAGAGSQFAWQSTVEVFEREGNILQYTFKAPTDGVLYAGTDFSFGDHSAQGTLALTGELVLEAERGSRVGVMQGYVIILSNDATSYDTFNHYSAAVGQSVYFEITYTLADARYTGHLFDADFTYNESGYVDFTQLEALPEPAARVNGPTGVGLRLVRSRAPPAN